MSQAAHTSITISLFKLFYKWYAYMRKRIIGIFQASQIYRFISNVCEKVKVYFRYSFLGRITEIKQSEPVLLDNSRAVQCLISFCKGCKDKVTCYVLDSSTNSLVKDAKEQFIFSPIRIASLCLVTAILVNAVLSVILQKQIDLWNFLIQVLFLFAGTAGLSTEADWSSIKEDSIFLRKTYKG